MWLFKVCFTHSYIMILCNKWMNSLVSQLLLSQSTRRAEIHGDPHKAYDSWWCHPLLWLWWVKSCGVSAFWPWDYGCLWYNLIHLKSNLHTKYVISLNINNKERVGVAKHLIDSVKQERPFSLLVSPDVTLTSSSGSCACNVSLWGTSQSGM